MKNYLLGAVIIVTLFSCDSKEKALQTKVDSLSIELNRSKEVEANMNEVAILIDSIDASRQSLQTQMIEGSTYGDYVKRLQDINAYVKETERKLAELESSSQNTSRQSAASIRRLKADLESRSKEILELEMKLAKASEENLALWIQVNEKDSLLSVRDQMIKMNESDIISMEKLVNDTQNERKETVANLYYAQAEALELAAKRTKLAPRKKKDTKREALELYKLSYSLGKEEAQSKIETLEKDLS